jgi:hypothetical protein
MPIHQKHTIFQMSSTQIEPKFYAQILCQHVVFSLHVDPTKFQIASEQKAYSNHVTNL